MSISSEQDVSIRKAVMSDVLRIQELINHYASTDIMLPKSLNQLYENLRDYMVLEKDGKIIGCGALHFFWEDLAEIRSLAIDAQESKKGYGSVIVEALVKEAVKHKITKVFCLTLAPGFFSKLRFVEVPHSALPQKVYKDCINCVKLGKCDEIAMTRDAI